MPILPLPVFTQGFQRDILGHCKACLRCAGKDLSLFYQMNKDVLNIAELSAEAPAAGGRGLSGVLELQMTEPSQWATGQDGYKPVVNGIRHVFWITIVTIHSYQP